MQRLFIAEKPELAKAIVEGLGGGTRCDNFYVCGSDTVTWCIGHMLELYDPEDYDSRFKTWSLDDLPIHHWPVKYKVKKNTKEQFKTIKTLMDEADVIVHAGDPDPEGQLIVDEILEYCGNKKPVKRFMTNDNNKKIVQRALANLKDNKDYYSLYQSALARNVGDQSYGYNMTRAYTVAAQKAGFEGVLSVGRVQTPILGLVVNRDRANANHEKQFYFDVIATFQFSNHTFPAKYQPADDAPVDDKKRITDKSFAKNIAQQCVGKDAKIENLDSEIKKASPPLPYNMLKLQADAAKHFSYKPDKVMKITQELREKHRLITYNGSDCQYLNEEQHEDAPNVLKAIAQTATEYSDLVSRAEPSIKSRAFNNKNVSAHHAIIPTEATVDLSEISEPLRKVYLLIAKAYIAQFYPKQEYRDTTVAIECSDHKFSVRSKTVTKEGWRVLYKKSQNDEGQDDDSIEFDLSQLSQSEPGHCDDINVEDKETKPLALYTMQTLLLDLTRVAKYVKDPAIKKLLVDKDKDTKGEHGGIGTSRTRDIHLKNLFDRGFLADKGKKIVSTDLGKQFFDALPEVATRPDMTALWHEQQSRIEKGNNTTENFIAELASFIGEQVDTVKSDGLNIEVETFDCPKCEAGILKKRKGKNGVFWACNNYPECTSTLPNKAGKPDYKSLETHPCPSCEKPMKRRKGSNGYFWGCTGYPECKTTLQDSRGKPKIKADAPIETTEFKCGECDSKLVRRVSTKGKGAKKRSTTWYGCSAFPGCKKTYFDSNGRPNFNQ